MFSFSCIFRYGSTGSYVDVSRSAAAEGREGRGGGGLDGAFSTTEGEVELVVKNVNDSPFIVGGKMELKSIPEVIRCNFATEQERKH